MSERTAGTVLLVPPLAEALADEVAASYPVLRVPEGDRRPFLVEQRQALADVVAIVCTNLGAVDAELIAALPRLGIVANHGVGYDNVDLEAARERAIAVTNTPGVLDDAVAETALALLLAVRRRVVSADRFVREGRWQEGAFPLTDQIAGSRVGIVGLGRIGGAIAQRLGAFGAEVSYHSRHRVDGVAWLYADSVTSLARKVDSLIAVVPGGPATDGLIDATVLDALGPEGVLINVARGSVVDQDALIRALNEGRLAGAGLDVFRDEPTVPTQLCERDDVVLLPHVGSGTHATRAAMRRLTVDNLHAWMAAEPLLTPVPELTHDG